jgi:hypothetical protein
MISLGRPAAVIRYVHTIAYPLSTAADKETRQSFRCGGHRLLPFESLGVLRRAATLIGRNNPGDHDRAFSCIVNYPEIGHALHALEHKCTAAEKANQLQVHQAGYRDNCFFHSCSLAIAV